MNQTVSVIIPVYNREAYIEECVLSVLQQTYQDFEILLTDDGSSDKSLDICRRLAADDHRIKLFSLSHVGVSGARNKGIDEAKGAYLFFIDSDDVIHPLLLESLVNSMEKQGVSIAAVKGMDIPNEEWEMRVCAAVLNRNDFDVVERIPNETMIDMLFNRDAVLGRMGGIMLRRDYVDHTRFQTDLRIGEDVCFVYENIIKGSDGVVLKGKGYFWRTHEGKVSWNAGFAASLSRLNCKAFLWRSEEKIGRTKYINAEKQGAVRSFISAQLRNPAYGDDSKKLRKVMKDHRKELFPALSGKQKFRFLWALYLPWSFCKIQIMIAKARKKHKK